MLNEVFKSAVVEKKNFKEKGWALKIVKEPFAKLPKLLNVREIACRE